MNTEDLLDSLVKELEDRQGDLYVTPTMKDILSNFLWTSWQNGYDSAKDLYGDLT